MWRNFHNRIAADRHAASFSSGAVAVAPQVLRDTSRRAQYDAARSATAAGPRGFPRGVYQPGVSEDAFEAAFRRWWEKAGAE